MPIESPFGAFIACSSLSAPATSRVVDADGSVLLTEPFVTEAQH
jgi:hypothetical protein